MTDTDDDPLTKQLEEPPTGAISGSNDTDGEGDE